MEIKQVSIGGFIGGLLGRCALMQAGWDCAYMVDGKDTVLKKTGVLSVRTEKKGKRYLQQIGKELLGAPYKYNIFEKSKGVWHVEHTTGRVLVDDIK